MLQHSLLLSSTRHQLLSNVAAGFSVFLIALPLCLGIAIFSHVPPFAGIVAGIIGGIVIGWLSRSSLAVSGPANSTALLIAEGVRQNSFNSVGDLDIYAGFQAVLVALFLAGIFQILLSFLKTGNLSHFIPSAVVKGMMAGIGVKLILYQLPVTLGLPSSYFSTEITASSLQKVFDTLEQLHPGALLLSLFCISILWILRRKKYAPLAFFVVVLGVGINLLFTNYLPNLALENAQLLSVLYYQSTYSFNTLFVFSHTHYFLQPQIWWLGLSLALVASLETLITLEALEKIDPQKRIVEPTRELWVQGVGNLLSSVFGGLPLTQTIIRSSANLSAGASSKASAITQGVLLLCATFFLSNFIAQIPLAVLASILIVLGYRLANPALFVKMYALSREQFAVFVTTMLGIAFANLMLGIILGTGLALLIILKNQYQQAYFTEVIQEEGAHTLYIRLGVIVSFLSKRKALATLYAIPSHIDHVVIDASKTRYIDTDVLEIILDFEQQERAKGIRIELINLNRRFDAARPLDALTQNLLQPQEVLQILKEGNQRFVSGNIIHKNQQEQIRQSSQAQAPMAIVLSCIDSRVPVEQIFDLGWGHLFSTRIAGNVLSKEVIASMEYACKYGGAKLIVVMGHSGCGAVQSALQNLPDPHLKDLLNALQPAITAYYQENPQPVSPTAAWLGVVCSNAKLQAEKILQESSLLQAMVLDNTVQVVSAVYAIETGVVEFFPSPSNE